MADVRTVILEFLRKGPPHNQLLSPLTDYLGICGNYGAATVHVPYEHEDFLPLLTHLRYQNGAKENSSRRQGDLVKVAEQMSHILASVPGLMSELSTASSLGGTLIHLSLVLSASELALLPFELTRVPPGCPGGEGNSLLLQTLSPVCLTRQVRTVSNKGVFWPRKPKILFVAAAPLGMAIPFGQHLHVLLKAILPWLRPFDRSNSQDLLHKSGEILTVLPNATIDKVEEVCSKESYTHVHVLAHGMEDPTQPGAPYGLALHSRFGDSKVDVVSGARFATALRGLREDDEPSLKGRGRLPAVATIASCDSGHVKDVVHKNGASFAHELHQSGIPFVVASQFPLSFPGSIHMAEVLYENLLWGEDPRIVLHRLRRRLYALHSSETHDWASMVAYATFPDDFDMQLLDVRYHRAYAAINISVKHIDTAIDQMTNQASVIKLEDLFAKVDEAARRMPTTGPYATEGIGLLASTEKRKAEVRFKASLIPGFPDKQGNLDTCIRGLREAHRLYERACRNKMSKPQGLSANRDAMHWVLCQSLVLGAVLGEPFQRGLWEAATISAGTDLEEADFETKAWGHSTLAELYLLLLAYKEKTTGLPLSHREAREKSLEHAKKVLSLMGPDSFQVYSTRKQFLRYVEWWGSEIFEAELKRRNIRRDLLWNQNGGVKDLAKDIVSRLPDSKVWM